MSDDNVQQKVLYNKKQLIDHYDMRSIDDVDEN